eukprot:1556970-Lingulodinium_polyedra.AAC.1
MPTPFLGVRMVRATRAKCEPLRRRAAIATALCCVREQKCNNAEMNIMNTMLKHDTTLEH